MPELPDDENHALPEDATIHDPSLDEHDRTSPVNDLAHQLAAFQIVKEETIQVFLEKAPDTEPLLSELERTGLITPFQHRRISKGEIASLRFDEYLVLDRLGSGGMGEVFKARNVELERIEAIKMIRPVDASNDRVLHRLRREAIALAQMEHPAIIPVFKVGRYDHFGYIAMKFINGEDLQRRVLKLREKGELLDVATACRWICTIAEALDHAHQRGIIHRDVKPSNLMIDSNDNIYLLDLGIARLVDPGIDSGQELTKARHALGTPQYMPPEQWADASEASAASDIYSLGCTLYFALTGDPPFATNNSTELMQAHMFKTLPEVSVLRTDVPTDLEKVLFKATEKDRSLRYRTAMEFANALAPFTDPASNSFRAIVPAKRRLATSRLKSKLPLAATICVLLLAVIAGLGSWWSLWDSNQPQPVPGTIATIQPSAVAEEEEPAPAEDPKVEEPVPEEPPPPPEKEPVPPWLVDYQKQHAEIWPNFEELLATAKQLAEGEITDALIGPAGKLELETARRTQMRLQNLLRDRLQAFQKQHPRVWPDFEELQSAAESFISNEDLRSTDQIDGLVEQLATETSRLRSPLASMNGQAVPKTWAETALPALRDLLTLHAFPPDPNWRLEVEFTDADGNAVQRASLNTELRLRVLSSRRAYVTLVQFDERDFMVLPLSEPIAPGVKTLLPQPELSFLSPGIKRFIVYATNKPFTGEIVFPLQNQAPLIQEWFASATVHSRVEKALVTGQPYPADWDDAQAETWAHTVSEIIIE